MNTELRLACELNGKVADGRNENHPSNGRNPSFAVNPESSDSGNDSAHWAITSSVRCRRDEMKGLTVSFSVGRGILESGLLLLG